MTIVADDWMTRQNAGRQSKTDAKYWEWHDSDQGFLIAQTIADLARDALRRGYSRYGLAALFEIARWEIIKTGRDAAGWKLNNNWQSRLSRELMYLFPELDGFFETRSLRT